jgi:hypothetical protein
MKILRSPDRLRVVAFVVFGILLTLLVRWKLPPFMGADEMNHIRRANMLTHGVLIGERFPTPVGMGAGSVSDSNLNRVGDCYQPMAGNPGRKVWELSCTDTVSSIGWGDRTERDEFSNTVVYPPIFYLPQTLAIGLGKLAGQSVQSTVGFARLLNALSCIAIGALAIALAGRARAWLFCVLLLPMTVALDATVTQDGLLIATAALASALLVRSQAEGRAATKLEISAAAICLGLVGMAKPPYVLLAFLLLAVHAEKKQWQFIACASALALGLAWNMWMAKAVQVPMYRPEVALNEPAQAQYLLHHIGTIPNIAAHTARQGATQYAAQVIGILGWLDTPLPKRFYMLAYLVLLVAAAFTYSGVSRRSLFNLGLLLFTFVSIFGALYLAFTPVGKDFVEGVQGRYFLPLLALAPLALVGRPPGRESKWTESPLAQRIVWGAVFLLPLISLYVTERALDHRFYEMY